MKTGSHFDERYPDGSLRDVGFHLVTEAGDELVRDHKDQDLRSFDGLSDVGNGDLTGATTAELRPPRHDVEQTKLI